MKFFKSILALAAAVFIGSSAWALETTETISDLEVGHDITPTADVSGRDHSGWQVDSSAADSAIATATMKTSTSTSTKRPTVTVTGHGNGTTKFTIKYGNSGSTWILTVKVEASSGIAKTVAVGKDLEFTDTLKNSNYYYRLQGDSGATTYVTSSPTSATQASGTTTGTLKLHGVKETASPVTVRLQQRQYQNSGTWSDVKVYSVTVTAKPMEFNYSGVNFEVSGASTNYVGGELVMTFTKSGSMTTDKDISGARVLAVGGGASGVAARYRGTSSNYYCGNGGAGGKVAQQSGSSVTLPQGTYSIVVGAGGEGITRTSKYWPENTQTQVDMVGGNSGRDSSISSLGSFPGLKAEGGVALANASDAETDTHAGTRSSGGTKAADGTGASGNGKTGVKSDISGPSGSFVEYGVGGVGASGKNEVRGADGTVYGQGGGGSANSVTSGTPSGSGFQGVVIVRVPQQVQPIADPVVHNNLTYNGNEQTGVAEGANYMLTGTTKATDAGNYVAYATPKSGYCWQDGKTTEKAINWKIERAKLAVEPTVATGLTYNGEEQFGYTAAGENVTLDGTTSATNVNNYTFTATPTANYAWGDGAFAAKTYNWSIGYKQATVTVVSTNKLFGAEEPVYQTKNEGFIAEDPTELTWTVFRTNASETVGTYDVLVAGEEFQGGYQISYNKGTLEIRAGKMTVNGKGYDNITDAFQDLLQNKGSATFNDTGIVYDGMTFQRGSTLTVAADNSWTVTNNGGTSLIATKIPGKMNLTVDGTFELSGDIFVAPMGEDDTIVTVTNFLLDASITVGKESNGATDAMAYLTFNTFTNEDPANRITLTTNGVIRSEEKLTIADVFTEPTKIKETQVDGWWEYTYLPLIPVDVPEAVDGLVYNGNEQTGVVENVGFTLTGNFATNADDYTAVATLADGYIWADGSSDPTNINWSIGKFAITVTPVATNKLVGAKDPELTYTTDVEPVEGDEFTGKLVRSEGEDVGTYDITRGTLAIDDKNYDLTFDTASGEDAFEIRAGKITVNGKGYDDVEEAFAALVLAAKSGTATATFNEEVEAQGYKFAQGAVLTIEEGGKWSLTGDVTMPMVEKEKKVSVDGALTLAGDIFVGDRADVTTEVLATNVVLAADVTVGAATEGLDPAGIATLAFDEIDVGDYKLTLTTNGVVQSATALDIDAIFEEVEHFHVAEKEVEGVYVYTLEASEFKVNYYDNDGETVVKSDTATILDYKKLHIWSGDRTSEGLELVKYEKETGGELARTDEALWAYIEEEAADDYCDGEVKVFGTWEKLNITIHVKADEETITEVWSGEDPVANDDLELPAETKEVTLTLEADVNLTVPVFKVVRGNVTNVTTKVATYAIKDGDTLEFFAEEAEWTDPDVTDDDIKTALIESIDDDDPDTREAAERKVNDVVGTGAKQVSARNLATYITDRHIQSSEIADCDYVAASVKLDTDDLITEETEVEIAELVKAEGDGLTFEVYIGEDQQSLSLVQVEAIKDMVEATSDLTDWVTDEHKLDVKAEFDPNEYKVTITPVNPTDKAFMRVVIPKDPGVK